MGEVWVWMCMRSSVAMFVTLITLVTGCVPYIRKTCTRLYLHSRNAEDLGDKDCL